MPLSENFFIFFVINVIFSDAFSAYFMFFSEKTDDFTSKVFPNGLKVFKMKTKPAKLKTFHC